MAAKKIYGGVDLVGGRAQHVADPTHDDDAATRGWIEALLELFAPTARVGEERSTPTLTIDAGAYDAFNVTNQGTAMYVSATGSPPDHHRLMMRISDNGSPQQITWDPVWFRDSGVAQLLGVTRPGRIHHVGLVFDAAESVFFCVAVDPVGAIRPSAG